MKIKQLDKKGEFPINETTPEKTWGATLLILTIILIAIFVYGIYWAVTSGALESVIRFFRGF